MPVRTVLLVWFMIGSAVVSTAWTVQFPSHSWLQFAVFLTAILLSSGLKVALPRGDGTMSLNFPFLLLAIVQLSPTQAILLAAISTAAQCRVRVVKLFTALQMAFNIASAICATAAALLTYTVVYRHHTAFAPALAVAAVAYFFCSTIPVALVIASSTGANAITLWKSSFPWYLPFYILGAVLAALADLISVRFGWATSLLLVPVVYTVYRSYTAQMTRMRERQQHLEEVEGLHLRTIEGLAMAIEAKDQNTHDHLFRVREYVTEMGQALQLSKSEMQALHTAAFLHDIGKLAVPEHIINKPGKLTQEEFEKMKIHPVVGADILERVRFPYPVVPIVRSHHEWWNGKGYPDGLKGEEIPIGARILTVVDCFDALASDRPYRKALPLPKAMELIKSLAGTQFDPRVVAILEQYYGKVEQPARAEKLSGFVPLNTGIEVWRGQAPGAGLEEGGTETQVIESARETGAERRGDPSNGVNSLNLIAAASQEAQALFEMSQSLGNSLSLNETISVMASRLHGLIPFDSCALYLRNGENLVAQYVDGEDAKCFSAQPIPFGEGISGWVAQNGKAILNGNAALELSYHSRPEQGAELHAALSVPLFDLQKTTVGVLTLYSLQADSFSREHLRILQVMESKLSLSLQNALRFRCAERDAETDFLTNLPNARRLFLQLETELSRCRRTGDILSVIVCDLNSFKQVNDRRGHMIGDMLLSSVAEGFRQNCRSCDTVARIGGDEFVFLIPGMDEKTAPERLASFAAAVATACWRGGLEGTVSASLGAAFYPADGDTAEQLLAVADRRMYLDKEAHYHLAASAEMPREAIAV